MDCTKLPARLAYIEFDFQVPESDKSCQNRKKEEKKAYSVKWVAENTFYLLLMLVLIT